MRRAGDALFTGVHRRSPRRSPAFTRTSTCGRYTWGWCAVHCRLGQAARLPRAQPKPHRWRAEEHSRDSAVPDHLALGPDASPAPPGVPRAGTSSPCDALAPERPVDLVGTLWISADETRAGLRVWAEQQVRTTAALALTSPMRTTLPESTKYRSAETSSILGNRPAVFFAVAGKLPLLSPNRSLDYALGSGRSSRVGSAARRSPPRRAVNTCRSPAVAQGDCPNPVYPLSQAGGARQPRSLLG